MRTRLILVGSVAAIIVLLALSYLLFYDRLFPTATPLEVPATPDSYVGVVQQLPDLPPPAGVDNRVATESPLPSTIPDATECQGAAGSQLQQCCAEWGHRNKAVQIQCIGSWQFVNNSCAYTCSSSVAAPTPENLTP